MDILITRARMADASAFCYQSNDVLQSLRINGNKIDNKGGMYFAQALQVNTALQDLDLADTDQVRVRRRSVQWQQ